MITFLAISGGLIWLFAGLVGAQLIWRSLPNEYGTFRYEWGPLLGVPFFVVLTASGPLTGYFYMSHLTANRILLTKGGAAIKADRERLLNKIYDKMLKDDMDIADIGKMKVEDLEMESDLPVI